MYLSPSEALSIHRCSKFPAIACIFVFPGDADPFISHIFATQLLGVVNIFVLYYEAIAQQQIMDVLLTFVELSVASACAHTEIVEEGVAQKGWDYGYRSMR